MADAGEAIDASDFDFDAVTVTYDDVQTYSRELVASASSDAERQDAQRLVAVLVREGIHPARPKLVSSQ